MANLDVIEFECPRCLARIRVAHEKAGQRIECSSCQGSLLVPSKSADQGLFDDIFESQPASSNLKAPAEKSDPVDVDTTSHSEQPGPAEEKQDTGLELDEDPLSGISVPDNPLKSDNPLEGDDPFIVDPDAALKVDGIGDVFSHADVYGIKCNICDTRIHVRPDQANTHVECPECYSKILVTPPEKTPNSGQRWVKEGRDKQQKKQESELKLSDPVERPKVEIDASYGLEAPVRDLLAPKAKPKPIPEDDGGYGLELMDDDEEDPAGPRSKQSGASTSLPGSKPNRPVVSKTRPANAGQRPANAGQRPPSSRREKYEESQRRQQAAEAGTAYRPENATDEIESFEFPSFEFGSLLSSAIEMIKSPGVIWRVMIAGGLMCFGAIAMEWFFPANTPPAVEGEGGTMIERLTQWAAWGILGGVPYLLGVLMLWFTSSYIFRDAALGHRRVESWKNAGSSELSGTFLIFSFGFFIGGLPALFIGWAIMPLRVLLGPLFLLSAWYSRSPFSIVNVDAFKNFSKDAWRWNAFYQFMGALAFIGFIAGLMFRIRAFEAMPFAVSVILTVPAVLMVVAITLLFAAVCGWHCGSVVQGLEESE